MKTLTLLTQRLNQWWRFAWVKRLQSRFASAPPKIFHYSCRSRQSAIPISRHLPLGISNSQGCDLNIDSSRPNNQQRTTGNRIAFAKKIGKIHQSLGRVLLKQLSGSLLATNLFQTQPLQPNCTAGGYSRRGKRYRPPLVLILAVVSLTSSMGHRLYNQPKLDVGTTAPTTISAPYSTRVEDVKTTEAQRKAVRRGLIPVLAIDSKANEQIYHNLKQYIDQIEETRQLPGPFPFTKTSILSLDIQTYLRDCPEWDWRTILSMLESESATTSKKDLALSSPSLQSKSTPTATPLPLSAQQQKAVAQLQAYRRSNSAQSLSALLSQISKARQTYARALAAFSEQYSELDIFQDAIVLQLSDADWQVTQTKIYQLAERILSQGIHPGFPTLLLQEAVNMQVKAEIPEAAQPLASKILMASLKPNLKEDVTQTRQQAERAEREVQPVYVEVQQGEVIIKAGEIISQADFVLLDRFGLSRRGINWGGLIGCGILVSGAVSVFWLVEKRFYRRLRQRDHLLILLLTLSTPLLVSLGLPYNSLPAIGLLIGSFYGSTLGVTVVGLLTLGLPIGFEIGWEHLLASAAGGLVASLIAQRLRSREELALLGVAVGLTEGFVYLAVNLILSASAISIWYTVIADAALHSLTGLAWSVVALGLSPYLEHLFDLVTPIRLAELANPNRPLLKRLAEEAPGTFQHTLFVATLAEAAAKALCCNVELVRTGTLYHDIGKLHDPQGFIENQMGGPNKHDEINDPYQSAEIIKKHVTEGLVMARRYRLPKAIQAFIPEHQGTILIAYFHHKAQQESKQPVPEYLFRYDGPTPQSRETGIVMLADACEAALRSLKDATYEEALSTVNKIFKARWQDCQLVDSGLKREEMPKIAEIFVQVWQQFHHKRIAYPKSALNCPPSKI
ncbi:MAG TPA: HDIG domain-containing metalloprotein [Leptolyngbyaceae cyanobacterium]